MQNIYFKNRILTVCRREELPYMADEKLVMRPAPDYDFSSILYMMESNTAISQLFLEIPEGMEEGELMDKLASKVKLLNAAGGLVTSEAGNFLMIYRNGVWDLPKGKQEEGEDIAVTALREVREESGVEAKEGELLIVTRHTYRIDGMLALKSTYWYSMKADENASTNPQTEEGIEKCEWVSPEDIDYRLANTYPSIVDVFDAALRK